jgi:hypothetical protein
MNRIWAVMLVGVCAIGFVGCNGDASTPATPAGASTETPAPSTDDKSTPETAKAEQ